MLFEKFLDDVSRRLITMGDKILSLWKELKVNQYIILSGKNSCPLHLLIGLQDCIEKQLLELADSQEAIIIGITIGEGTPLFIKPFIEKGGRIKLVYPPTKGQIEKTCPTQKSVSTFYKQIPDDMRGVTYIIYAAGSIAFIFSILYQKNETGECRVWLGNDDVCLQRADHISHFPHKM